MAIKGLIFDLDGVLVDTVPAHFKAWTRMFNEHGYEFSDSIYREHVDGRLRFDGAKAVMVHHSDAEIETAATLKNQYYRDMIERGEFEIFQTAIDTVRAFKADGYRLAAASSSRNVRDILTRIALIDAFDVVVGGNDVTNGKPHPEIFLKAASDLDLAVNECVVIEDAEAGVKAAKAGGFFCYGLGHDGPTDHLSEADRIITSLDQIDLARDVKERAV